MIDNGRMRPHALSLAWSLGVIVALLTILSILGILPWATRAEVMDLKNDIGRRLERLDERTEIMSRRVDDIYRAVKPVP